MTPADSSKLLSAIKKAQSVLAKYVLPEGGPSADDALNELLSILDTEEMARLVDKLDG